MPKHHRATRTVGATAASVGFAALLCLTATACDTDSGQTQSGSSHTPTSGATTTMSDAQTREQVIGPAAEIVAAAHLTVQLATLVYVSDNDQNRAPFAGKVEVTFAQPADAERYRADVVSAMRHLGWSSGAAAGQKFHGTTLHREALTAEVGPEVGENYAGSGNLTIYGDYRDSNDLGDRTPEDITAEVTARSTAN